MKGTSWFHLWVGGLILGILRGILEVTRLWLEYPVGTDLPILAGLLIPAYGITIAFAGLAIAILAWFLVLSQKTHFRVYMPAAWFLALALIDLWGVRTDVPTAARITRGLPAAAVLPEQAPDVLIVTIDTCRADHIGAYGNPIIRTPWIDRLAKHGTTAIEAIAPIPVTTSSHATIFTGLEPSQHGSRFNAVPISFESRTLAEIFRAHGYRTGGFVSAFPVIHEVSGLGRGFDVYDQLLSPSRCHPLVYRSTLLRGLAEYGPFRPAERKWFRVVPPVLRWWSGLDDQPRFTWVHFYDPHFPYQPGFPFDKMYLDRRPEYSQSVLEVAEWNRLGQSPQPGLRAEYKALYAGEISASDHAIGELISELTVRDRLKRTLVIITADHGESLDEHGYYFSHGDDLYDPSIRVPLLVFLAGTLPENRTVPGLFRLSDVADIALSLAGIADKKENQEISTAEILSGKNQFLPDRVAYSETGAGVYTEVHQPEMEKIQRKKRSIRTTSRKVIWNPENGISGYHLETDPGELFPYPETQSSEFDSLFRMLQTRMQQEDRMNPADQPVPEIPENEVLDRLHQLGYID